MKKRSFKVKEWLKLLQLHETYKRTFVGESSKVKLLIGVKINEIFIFQISSLFFYRECVYRAVQAVCLNSNLAIADSLIPFTRKQELAGCQSYAIYQCNSALIPNSSAILTLTLVLCVILLKNFPI